jgi:hypothetical protein
MEAKLLPFSSTSILKAHFASINGMLLAGIVKTSGKVIGGLNGFG